MVGTLPPLTHDRAYLTAANLWTIARTVQSCTFSRNCCLIALMVCGHLVARAAPALSPSL